MNDSVVPLCCQTLVVASEGKQLDFEHEPNFVDLFIANSLTLAALFVYSTCPWYKGSSWSRVFAAQLSPSITPHPNPANLQTTPTEQSSHNDI